MQENSMSNLNKTTLSESHWKDSASSLRGIVWRDRKETRNIARIRHDKANGRIGKTAVNGLDDNAFEAIFITWIALRIRFRKPSKVFISHSIYDILYILYIIYLMFVREYKNQFLS